MHAHLPTSIASSCAAPDSPIHGVYRYSDSRTFFDYCNSSNTIKTYPHQGTPVSPKSSSSVARKLQADGVVVEMVIVDPVFRIC